MPESKSVKTANSLARSVEAKSKQTLRTARSGATYVYESDEWRIGRTYILPWSDLKTNGLTKRVAPDLLNSFRRMMGELVEEVSEGFARSVFDQTRSLLQYCKDEITVESFERWRAWRLSQKFSKNTIRNNLISCRTGLNAWADGSFPGLEAGLTDHVNRIRVGRSEMGRAVRELCPVRGPFSQTEEAALIRWLHEAYADGVLSLQAYAILLLMVEFGCRPIEIGALRAGDVLDAQSSQPHQLAIPTAKGGRGYRASFRTMELRTDLYALLKQVIAEGQAAVAQTWGQPIRPRISKQIPLFVGKRVHAAGDSEGFEHRLTKMQRTYDIDVWNHIKWSIRNCPVTTERLRGDLLPISLYRFRRTVATRLAEAGASDETIAAVLGHDNFSSLQDYTAHTYADQEASDAIMVEAWRPIMERVADRLLESPIPGQARIKVSRNDEVGNCAQLCGGGILTCYLCPKFRPFVHAQHERALGYAESLKQSRIDHGMSGPEVDSLDQSISAINATIRVCMKFKERKCHDG